MFQKKKCLKCGLIEVLVIDNKMFSDYIFIMQYTTKEDSYEVETFTKAQKEVADF
ncbi:hypothetical protein AM12_014 [Lactococcus phage AM12]|uniref:Uncharacterized protein n=1 Tax=Lactococcus phage AM12 TaxID=1965469 RepID=A0A1X9SHP1_9CAUD|nr:hypothetical protein AM12_014 [Lactococcus phage AM12]